jgi:NAD(P)H-dependent FMN reductase
LPAKNAPGEHPKRKGYLTGALKAMLDWEKAPPLIILTAINHRAIPAVLNSIGILA